MMMYVVYNGDDYTIYNTHDKKENETHSHFEYDWLHS